MKLEQSFDVQAPIDVVWRALNDLERVAPCLPGATITGHDEDGSYRGEFKVKLGATTAAYRGTIRIQAADEATHTTTLAARGSDKRGQGGATATIVNTLEEVEGVTRVHAMTDFSITGRLARFGRGGMIEEVSSTLLENFAACLATRLADGAPPAGPDAPAAVTRARVASAEASPAATGAALAAGSLPAGGGTLDGGPPPDGSWSADPADAAAAPPPAAAAPSAAAPPEAEGPVSRVKRLFRGGGR